MRTALRAMTLVVCLGTASVLVGQNITSITGDSSWGRILDVAVDSQGNRYFCDYDRHIVRRVDRFGTVTIFAGTGTVVPTGDGGPATAARLINPAGLAVGPDGSIYIAEYGGDRIRKVAQSGIITTVAGTGAGGFTGNGGPATNARINAPIDVVVDAANNIYFSDSANYRIRRVAANGTISTFAGFGTRGFSGDGGPATAANIYPGWLALGPDGTLYFTDDGWTTGVGSRRVRKVVSNGTISTVAGGGGTNFSGDGGLATAAGLVGAQGVAVDGAGNIYISDYNGNRIRRVLPSGVITTHAGTGTAGFTGDGGPAAQARVNNPCGLAIEPDGTLYFADAGNRRVRKIDPPPVPAINSSNAAVPSFLGKAGFGSNMYVEIYGTSLSLTTRTWAGTDFNGANAPTVLDGVRVSVNGRPAYIYFVSPGQININTPEDTSTGPVNIQVTNALGTSNLAVANRTRVSPTLQSIPQFNVGGKNYVVAQTPDFRSFIGPPNLLAGVPFTQAAPGATVLIYALGCGPTTPATQAGIVAAQNSPLALPFEIRIGGVTAQVPFAGAVAGAIGLYQFNVVIPNVPAGDQTIELTVDNVPNGQNLVITVAN